MANECEACVDELLRRQLLAEQLLARFQDPNFQDETASLHTIAEARSFVLNTQTFIDNNRAVIPSYCLKKVTDVLRMLEININRPKKTNFQFKFRAPSQRIEEGNLQTTQEVVMRNSVGCSSNQHTVTTPETLGFRDKTKQTLFLNSNEVHSKDVSLINLDQCNVRITGPANTVYIRNLTNTKVTVFLACRSITITNCRDCHFELVCQQLRIDSTQTSRFDIFTSARSMLESSKALEFAELKFDSVEGIESGEIDELLTVANFNKSKNNWKCIDDFDWLSSNTPSKNFKLASGP